MLKLYGFPISNYTNIVALALLEKGIEFEYVLTRPGKNPDYLNKSPMGKVPFLETEQGYLSETQVILEYLEETGKGPSLYPADVFARAKARELIRQMELYIELPARRIYPDAFFGGETSEKNRTAVRSLLEKGFASVKSLAQFSPYIAGSQLSYADFYAYFALGLATRAAKIVYSWHALDEFPELKTLLSILAERESFQKVIADQKAAMAAG
ncbi:MAG: glutathione S-transferase family protein [SAR324 cluster bacterium]|nr:glutathione S-transferase family protein [SAR324 cluster bacterium]